MKIIRNGIIYVQKKDIAYLNQVMTDSKIPISTNVFDKIFGKIFICTEQDHHEFIPYEGSELIDFFSNLDYIVNYDELKDKTNEEIELYVNELETELNNFVDEFNRMDFESRKNKYAELSALRNIKELRLDDVKDILLFRQGYLHFDIPSEQTYSFNPSIEGTRLSKKRGFRQLVKTIFGKHY